jgi:hypothetical protein
MEHRGELSGIPQSESPAEDSWAPSDSVPTLQEAKDAPTVIEVGGSRASLRPSLAQEVVRGLDFFVFVSVVAGLSFLSFSWLSAKFGNDETRDRRTGVVGSSPELLGRNVRLRAKHFLRGPALMPGCIC